MKKKTLKGKYSYLKANVLAVKCVNYFLGSRRFVAYLENVLFPYHPNTNDPLSFDYS